MALKEVNFEVLEQIASIVGEEKAYEVCMMFVGEQIFFPKAIIRAKRNFDIRKKFNAGATYKELAKKYNLTSRRVREICHEPKDQYDLPGQYDLFEALG